MNWWFRGRILAVSAKIENEFSVRAINFFDTKGLGLGLFVANSKVMR